MYPFSRPQQPQQQQQTVSSLISGILSNPINSTFPRSRSVNRAQEYEEIGQPPAPPVKRVQFANIPANLSASSGDLRTSVNSNRSFKKSISSTSSSNRRHHHHHHRHHRSRRPKSTYDDYNDENTNETCSTCSSSYTSSTTSSDEEEDGDFFNGDIRDNYDDVYYYNSKTRNPGFKISYTDDLPLARTNPSKPINDKDKEMKKKVKKNSKKDKNCLVS
jgi:hypothetical protein